MTDEILKGIAAQAFNMAKLDRERGQFIWLIASYYESDERKLHRMSKLEKLVNGRFGEDWLNHHGKKDAAFGLIRFAVDTLPPDALAIATAINMFAPTDKLEKLPREEQQKLLEGGHNGHLKAVAKGLFTIHDALSVIAQTPERVCLYSQVMGKRGESVGPPEVKAAPQAGFAGRLKMFGKESKMVNLTQRNGEHVQ